MKTIILTLFFLFLYQGKSSDHDPSNLYIVEEPLVIRLECGQQTSFIKGIKAGNDLVYFRVIVECNLLSNNQYTD